MMSTPLQLSSVNHNPSCDGCAHDAEKRMQTVSGRQNVAKEKLNVCRPFRQDKEKNNVSHPAASIRIYCTWKLGYTFQLTYQPHSSSTDCARAVVPNLGVNYPSGVACDSSGSNAEPKTMLFFIYIMSDNCEILRVLRCNRYLDLGNGSNKFGNHCVRDSSFFVSDITSEVGFWPFWLMLPGLGPNR